MHKLCFKLIFVSLALGMMLGGFPSQIFAKNEELQEPQEPQEEGVLQETTVLGIIDRISDTEVVIGDSLFLFAPGRGLNNSTFSEGQRVSGELDEHRRIRSMRRASGDIQAPQAARQETSTQPDIKTPDDNRPIINEQGVWKN